MRWLAVLLVLWPASASAHSLDFGVLRVVETEAGAELVLRASGHEGVPPDVTLATRGGCELEGDPHRAAAAPEPGAARHRQGAVGQEMVCLVPKAGRRQGFLGQHGERDDEDEPKVEGEP